VLQNPLNRIAYVVDRDLRGKAFLILSVHCPKCQALKSNQAAWKTLTELQKNYPIYFLWLEAQNPITHKVLRYAFSSVKPVIDPELMVPVMRIGTPMAVIFDLEGHVTVIMPETNVPNPEIAFARIVADTVKQLLPPKQRQRKKGE